MISRQTILEEWSTIRLPDPPEVGPVTADPARTALLVLDIQQGNCAARPRCVATLAQLGQLVGAARAAGALVVYSLTRGASASDILSEVAPLPGEPVVAAGVDKFYGTPLEEILRRHGCDTVVITGTSAHGAVLHTATGAALRGFRVVVPVDGMSAGEPFAELYTAWHLLNAPGTRRQATLTLSHLINFGAPDHAP